MNDVVTNTFDAETTAERAARLGAEAGDVVNSTLETIADAKQEMAGGPVRTMIALRKVFGEKLDEFPRPGEEDGNNRDKLVVDRVVNGEHKSVKTTFYTEFCDNLSIGAAILSRIDQCKRARDPKAIRDDIPKDIQDMVGSLGAIDRELDRLTNRRATFRASVKRAMELVYQFNAIANVPLIEAEPIWEDGKEGEDIISSPKCIVVWQTPEEGKPVKHQEDYTVQSFLKFNAAAAIEAGGGFKNLEATLARKTKASGQEGTKADRKIASMGTLVGVLIEAHSYMATEVIRNRDRANYDKLIKALKSNKTPDETVDALVEMRNFLDDIIGDAGLQARWDKLQEAA